MDTDYLVWEKEHSANSKVTTSEWRPRVAEFNVTNYLLLQLVNLTGTLASERRIKKFKQLDGPRTEHSRADKVAEASHVAHLFGALIPGG